MGFEESAVPTFSVSAEERDRIYQRTWEEGGGFRFMLETFSDNATDPYANVKGFAGRDFERFITEDLGPHLIRPDRKDEKPRFGKIGLEDHDGWTLDGVYARVAARLLALAAGIWHNWRINAPRKRSLIAYDH